MDWFLFWDCLAVIGAIVVHRWAAIAVARYADGDPSRAPSVATLVARSAEGLGHAIRRRFGGNAMSLRFAGLSVLGALLLGGVPVVAGALVFAPAPVETMAFAGRFFAAPVSLAAWLSLMGTVFALRLAGRRPYPAWQLGLAVTEVVAVCALWLAAIHVGLWLHWRGQFSPLGFATEWYYAEVYFAYVREPAGWGVLVGSLLPVFAPAAFYVDRVLREAGGRAIGRAPRAAVAGFASIRRSVVAAGAVAAGLAAKLAQAALAGA